MSYLRSLCSRTVIVTKGMPPFQAFVEIISTLSTLHSFVGHHFCLKCHATVAEENILPGEHAAQPTPSSLSTLASDLQRCMTSGAAKQRNTAML